MSVGPEIGDRESLSLDVAEFVKPAAELVNERILGRGVVENADTRYPLYPSGLLNARTAKALSLTLPSLLMTQADEIVE